MGTGVYKSQGKKGFVNTIGSKREDVEYKGRNGKIFHYGDEYETIKKIDSINAKIVKKKIDLEARLPKDSLTPNRIYAVTVGNGNNSRIKSIGFLDKNGKTYKQIDLIGSSADGPYPHVHLGYYHNENGYRTTLSKKEKRLVKIIENWRK